MDRHLCALDCGNAPCSDPNRIVNMNIKPAADHPHRQILVDILRQFSFQSVLEIGCGSGVNLYNIKQTFPNVSIYGIDVSSNAIKEARKNLPEGSILEVGDASDNFCFPDKSIDIVLSDACLIYLNQKNFKKALKEAKRVARVGVIFCEFHHVNFFVRLAFRFLVGFKHKKYNIYNYEENLKRAGFNNIKIKKLTDKDWPHSTIWKIFGSIIYAIFGKDES